MGQLLLNFFLFSLFGCLFDELLPSLLLLFINVVLLRDSSQLAIRSKVNIFGFSYGVLMRASGFRLLFAMLMIALSRRDVDCVHVARLSVSL